MNSKMKSYLLPATLAVGMLVGLARDVMASPITQALLPYKTPTS